MSYLEVVVLPPFLILDGPLGLDEFGPELVGLLDEWRVGRRTLRREMVDLRGKGTLEDWQGMKGRGRGTSLSVNGVETKGARRSGKQTFSHHPERVCRDEAREGGDAQSVSSSGSARVRPNTHKGPSEQTDESRCKATQINISSCHIHSKSARPKPSPRACRRYRR